MVLVCATSIADARPRRVVTTVADPNCNILWPCEGVAPSPRGLQIERALPFGRAQRVYTRQVSSLGAPTPNFGYSASTLVDRARAYLGRSGPSLGLPARLWCADFMNMVTGGGTGSRVARSWLSRPRVSPQVGAVAVLGRRGGGHVGIVSGFTAGGDPIIVSGNHGRRVGEGVYSRSRVIAYVSAS